MERRMEKVGNNTDSFPIGVSADSYPLNGPQQGAIWFLPSRRGPQTGVINKIYNILHHVLG